MTAALASDLAGRSLCEIVDLATRGQVSAVEIASASFALVDALDPVHHAFVSQDRDGAMAAAARIDAERARGGEAGLLHGAPLAHKDMYDREGRVSANGSRVRAGHVAHATADVIERLDGAGALDLGRLAMVEFAMGPHGFNANLPRALNPWGHDRIPCGSSSGSGVAVSSRMVAGSLGSDTGGSIRCPAAANGIVGCVPTNSLVSRRGVMPMSWSLDVVGPLTRTVRDAARMLRVIAHPGAGASVDYEAGLEAPLAGLRIGVPEGYFDQCLAPDVAAALDRSRDVFAQSGATLVPVCMPAAVALSSSLHPLVMKAEGAANHRPWKRDRSSDYSEEVGRRLEAGFFILATDYINALQYRASALREMLNEVFDKVDAVHAPVLPIATPTLDETAYRDGPAYLDMVVSLTRNTRPINFLGLTALSVPCGYTADGMPTSFQLIGRPFSEPTLFRLGHRYERETAWYRDVPRTLQRNVLQVQAN